MLPGVLQKKDGDDHDHNDDDGDDNDDDDDDNYPACARWER